MNAKCLNNIFFLSCIVVLILNMGCSESKSKSKDSSSSLKVAYISNHDNQYDYELYGVNSDGTGWLKLN